MAAFPWWEVDVTTQALCHHQPSDFNGENINGGEIYLGGIGFKKPYG
jgi:hypothetical protein